jgi:hypothetical protein
MKKTNATYNAFLASSILSSIYESRSDNSGPYENLGNGYELRPIEIKDKEGSVIPNRDKYSHLYHNGLKISDEIFRKGGTGGDFKDDYCQLIHYTREREHELGKPGFNIGNHVIINSLGEICLSGGKNFEYPSHCGGNIGRIKDSYYNLITGEEIITCSSSSKISGKNFIIVEHCYSWYNKSLPLGIYKIDKMTCEIEKIDEAKK